MLEEAGRRELHLRRDGIPDRHLESDAVPGFWVTAGSEVQSSG